MLRYSNLVVNSKRTKTPEEKMSIGERMWQTYWAQFAPYVRPANIEHRFSQDRKFRFDFAWPDILVAVEIEGGEYSRGRHTRAAGYQADCEKYNLAADLGWTVYRYTPTMLQRDPASCVSQVAQVVSRRLAQGRAK